MFTAGNCYWIETNKKEDGTLEGHFFVIALEYDSERIIIVNIDKIGSRKHFDKTTIIRPGEGHEFIVRDSYVNYRRARLISIQKIRQLLKDNIAKYRGMMDMKVITKIIEGIGNSPYTKNEVKELYFEYLYKKL